MSPNPNPDPDPNRKQVAAIKRKLDPSSTSVPGLGQGFDSQSYATLAENAAAALDDEVRVRVGEP